MSAVELVEASVYYLQQYSPFLFVFFVIMFAEDLISIVRHSIFAGDHD